MFKPKLYIDMDGVLCDFLKAAVNCVNWEISKLSRESFFDNNLIDIMCVAEELNNIPATENDFWNCMTGYDRKDRTQTLRLLHKLIDHRIGFWANLEKTSTADELWEHCRQYLEDSQPNHQLIFEAYHQIQRRPLMTIVYVSLSYRHKLLH